MDVLCESIANIQYRISKQLDTGKKMTNSTDVSDMKMTRFGYRVDLIRERHVRVKDEAKIASRGTAER